MHAAYHGAGDITVLPHFEPAGPLGFLPINAYLIKSREPILIETGLHTQTDAFLETLRGEIDPRELRWILLTHEDMDHAGGLERLLEAAPDARLVLSFLAMLKYGRPDLTSPERVLIATPGEAFSAGDRRFHVVRPPVFDSSATVGYYDEKTRSLFSADSFGGLVPMPTHDLEAIGEGYIEGSTIFMSANSAWLHDGDPVKFTRAVDAVRTLDPEWLMPTHGAPLQGRTAELCDHLSALPAREPYHFPNDATFRMMLEQMKAQQQGERAA